jgi:hypothetical protein
MNEADIKHKTTSKLYRVERVERVKKKNYLSIYFSMNLIKHQLYKESRRRESKRIQKWML